MPGGGGRLQAGCWPSHPSPQALIEIFYLLSLFYLIDFQLPSSFPTPIIGIVESTYIVLSIFHTPFHRVWLFSQAAHPQTTPSWRPWRLTPINKHNSPPARTVRPPLLLSGDAMNLALFSAMPVACFSSCMAAHVLSLSRQTSSRVAIASRPCALAWK